MHDTGDPNPSPSSSSSPRLLLPVRWVLTGASWLVPRRLRAEWRREWEAELASRWSVLARWGRHDRGPARDDLIRQARGAFRDALWLKIRELREGIFLDLRHSLRRLRREPGFAVAVLALMGLGIGANTALFSIVQSVLLEPLPYPQPERLVRVWETHEALGREHETPSPGNFQEWRRLASATGAQSTSLEEPADDTLGAPVFDGMASWYESSLTVQGDVSRDGSPAEMRNTAQVSNDFFRVAGVTPLVGRPFTDEEVDRSRFSSSNTHIGADPVVILSERLWRQRFGGDPDLIGQTVRIERKEWLVAGVMPEGFALPSPEIDLWIPSSYVHPRPRDQHYTPVMARLAPGVTLEAAQSRLAAVAAEMEERFPETNRGWGVRLTPLADEVVGAARPALWSLLGAVACVLLIIALNVAGLELVRSTSRQQETAVRVALGASQGRLIRQSLIESLVLAGAGGGLGVALAIWGVDSVRGLELPAFPRLAEVALDGRTLAFAAVVTCLTGLLFGLGPAVASARPRVAAALKDGGSATTASPGRQSLRRVLVVAEVAMAVVLLVGAGLLARSFLALSSVDPGFRADRVLVLPILLDGKEYSSGARSRAYYRELSERLARLPGVEAVGGATALPLSPVGPDFFRPAWREGAKPSAGEAKQADVRMVTAGYLDTLRIPLLQGRAFDDRDTADSEKVVMVNQTLARQHWGDESPVGHSLVLDYATNGTHPYRVVGVVGDVRFYGPRTEPRPEVYLPHPQMSYLILNMAVRTAGDPMALADAVRREVLALDPEQPVHSLTTLDRLLGRSVERERISAWLMTVFAAVALLLAAIGLYGLISYQVTHRVKEIGIRRALGARAVDVVRMVIAEGLPLVAIGLLLGGFVALPLARLLASQLYGIGPTDPATFALVAVLLIGAALLACWLPARRAARVDPSVALKTG